MSWPLLAALLLAGPVDPAADQTGPFEYFTATETRLVPFALTSTPPRARLDAGFRVLADGQLASPRGRLALFVGDPPRPLSVRVKRWLGPTRPILLMTDRLNDIQLQLSMLTVASEAFPDGLAMVRLSARAAAGARLAVTAGFIPDPGYPARWPAHDLTARYGFEAGTAWRDGRLLYQFPQVPGHQLLAAMDLAFDGPFTLRDVAALRETPVALVRYDLVVGPTQSTQLVFKMPRAGLAPGEALPALRAADFDEAMLAVAKDWDAWHGTQPMLAVAEDKVAGAYLAALRRRRVWGPPPSLPKPPERLLGADLSRSLVVTKGHDGRLLGSPFLTALRGRLLVARGRQREAAEALYAILLHSAASHDFADGIPLEWLHRERFDAWGTAFDSATAAAYTRLVEDMLVRVAGDRLIIGSAIPPAWLAGGQQVVLERLATPFGTMGLTVTAGAEAITYRWSGQLVGLAGVDVMIPWYLSGAVADGGVVTEHGLARCRPEAGELVLRGGRRPLPDEPSYRTAVEAYRRGYRERAEAYAAAGGTFGDPQPAWPARAERAGPFEELYGGG